MSDRYLYKAKRKNWRELPEEKWWVQGYLFCVWEQAYILWGTINDVPDMKEVDPATICQCTGLRDKNGNLIWENDTVKHDISDTIGTVKWYSEDYVGWCVNDVIIDEQQFSDEMWSECEVIDNPELLEGGAE